MQFRSESVLSLLLVYVISGNSSPIFSNEGFTSLLARASTPPQSGNIINLRSSRIQKFEKQEIDNLNNTDIEPEEPQNEVVPSLLNKKINKILQKIQIISSLSSGFLQGANGENPGDMNYENTDYDEVNKFNTTIFTSNSSNETSNLEGNENKYQEPEDESFKVVFDVDAQRRSEDKIEKLEDLEVKDDEQKEESDINKNKANRSNSVQFLPLNLIASLMQTFGSIMGHAYRSLIYFSQQNKTN